ACDFPVLADIRGDLHCHSNYSDGKASMEEMILAFLAKGYDYCAISDHSKLMPIAKGMDEAKIKSQWREMDLLREKYTDKIKILRACEVDILKNGSLDFADEI